MFATLFQVAVRAEQLDVFDLVGAAQHQRHPVVAVETIAKFVFA